MHLEMQVEANKIACFADGKPILTSPIPPALVGSTVHGFGLDVNPAPGRPPDLEVINGPFTITPLK